MDSSVSPKDEKLFLRVCHDISNAVYHLNVAWRYEASATRTTSVELETSTVQGTMNNLRVRKQTQIGSVSPHQQRYVIEQPHSNSALAVMQTDKVQADQNVISSSNAYNSRLQFNCPGNTGKHGTRLIRLCNEQYRMQVTTLTTEGNKKRTQCRIW